MKQSNYLLVFKLNGEWKFMFIVHLNDLIIQQAVAVALENLMRADHELLFSLLQLSLPTVFVTPKRILKKVLSWWRNFILDNLLDNIKWKRGPSNVILR